MKNLKPTARIFYGLGIAGIGLLHFFYAGFRPVILPVPPEATAQVSILVYVTGAILLAAGLAIVFGIRVKTVALLLALVLLLFFLLGHLPNRLLNMPAMLGAWTDALKLLALSGGALLVAKVAAPAKQAGFVNALDKFTFLGRYFFGIMLFLFGIDHFLYTDFVKTLVPLWIPGPIFWTYFAGVALMGSGLAFIIRFKIRTISILAALMLFLWLVLLHIPRAIAMDTAKDPNEIVSVLECLSFCGIALLLYFDDRRSA